MVASAATLGKAWPSQLPAVALASVDIAAALLFLVRRLEGVAGIILIGVFATAFVVSSLSGDNPARFVYYAATVLHLWGRSPHRDIRRRLTKPL